MTSGTRTRRPLGRLSSTDALTFLREAVRDHRTTGAVSPSSAVLARALVLPVEHALRRPMTVLEVGAGTGSVTTAILDALPGGSRLDVVEVNPRFAPRLRERTAVHPRARELAAVRVHTVAVQELVTDARYDVIVSGLPLTNFDPAEVDAVMTRCTALLAPGGVLTYFGYVGTRAARTLLAPRPEVARHRAVDAVVRTHRSRHESHRHTVWANVPPAHVWRLRAADAPGGPA